MDLSTRYMGLALKNPLVVASSPVSASGELIRRAVDAGAAAVVLYSLFEEQFEATGDRHPYLPHKNSVRFPPYSLDIISNPATLFFHSFNASEK